MDKEEAQRKREKLLAARAEVLTRMTDDGRRAFEQRQAANADGPPAGVEQQDGGPVDGGNLAYEIELLIGEVRRLRQDAQAKGDVRLALRGVDTGLRALALYGRATGEIMNARRPAKDRAQAIVTHDEAVRTSAEVLLAFATPEQIAHILRQLEHRLLELQSARVSAAGASSSSVEQISAALPEREEPLSTTTVAAVDEADLDPESE